MDIDLIIAPCRDAVPDLIALYAFGSQVSGDARPGSDVDLAILTPHAISPSALLALREAIEACLHRDVDLIDLRAASTVMRLQVISTGRCLFSANDGTRQTFEMVVYSSYARLNEERRGILDDIRGRGSIYAR